MPVAAGLPNHNRENKMKTIPIGGKVVLASLVLSGCSYLAPNTGSFGEGALSAFNIWLQLHNSPAAMQSRANYMAVGLSQSQPNRDYSGITQYNQASRQMLNPSTPIQEITINNPVIIDSASCINSNIGCLDINGNLK